MATAALPLRMSVEEYLRTPFRPDVDFVDGFVEERNLGTFPHARLQFVLARILARSEDEWGVYIVPETRVQTMPRNFRVPDVCIVPVSPEPEDIVRHPPLLCVEVLSPEDRMSRELARAQEFHRMGVPAVWIFDPIGRNVTVSTPEGSVPYTGGLLAVPGTPITLDPQEAFTAAQPRS